MSETLFDPTAPLTASGNLQRRKIVNRLAESTATGAALLAVAVLGIVTFTVVKRGIGAISWDFLTKNPPAFGTGGGIAPAIVGTIVISALATAIAMPIGVLIALFLTEFAGTRAAHVIRLVLDLLNGLPTIVVGVFVFGLLVAGHQQSAFAGSLALAIIMLPLIARSTQEVLALVPTGLREASLALGVPRWRTTLGIVLPQTVGGVVTGATLAIARAAGETAPLLFTSSIAGTAVNTNPHNALASIPVTIFEYSEAPDPESHAQAWAAALVLIAFVLVASIGARAFAARSRRRLGQSR
jgi:phosphate transport system permease protein